MTKNPVACDAGAPLKDAARLMHDNQVGSVVVLRDGKVAGILTDRMIACDALGQGSDGDTSVAECMVDDVASVHKEDNVFAAVDTLRSAGVVRRVPVVNTYAELEGILSIADVATVAERLLDAVLLEETNDATDRVRVQTGAKRIGKVLRMPTKQHQLPPDEETHVTREPTAIAGSPDESGHVPDADRTRPQQSR